MTTKHILIVDDSPTEQYFLSDLLGKNGYQISIAGSGEEAIEKANGSHDLILMDIVMPGMNGFMATRTLSRNESTKHIPIIICTTKNQETDRIWGIRQGAKDFVSKPVDINDLLLKIKNLLAANDERPQESQQLNQAV